MKEKQVFYCKTGHEKAHEIRNQGSWNAVACIFDPGGTEVNADGIEGGFRGAQHHGGGSADQGIHTVLHHQLRSHGQGGAAADGTDQHKYGRFRRDAKAPEQRRQKTAQQFHSAG